MRAGGPPPEAIADLLLGSKSVLVFTGAGISTGSGIPDFRGPQGIWKRRQPVYFQEFIASDEKRVEHWDYKLEGWDAFQQAEPNAGHLALVDLERMQRLETLVTQNIDGMHHRAGNAPHRIIELHGTNRQVECLTCGRLTDPEPAMDYFRRTRLCPQCPCGGWMKTATVSFGQPMPEDKLRAAMEAAERADLVIAIGSTLTVQPAESVPRLASRRGIPYVIINQGETSHDPLATLRVDADASVILPAIVARLLAGEPPAPRLS